MNQELQNEWIADLQKELGVYLSSNMALTIQAKHMDLRIAKLEAEKAALLETNTALRSENQTLLARKKK